MLRAVIFDLDGTLLDTPGVIVSTAQDVLRDLGHAQAGDALAIRATIGLPLPVAFGKMLRLADDAPLVLDAVERYRVAWRRDVSPHIAQMLYPGVAQGLPALKARGLGLSVATGKAQAGAEGTLQAAGLLHLFEVVLGYDAVPNPKPAPDMALAILQRLEVRASDAIVVGDSTIDLQMASGAGVRSIAVTYGAHDETMLRSAHPSFVARSFAEVLAILDALVAEPAAH